MYNVQLMQFAKVLHNSASMITVFVGSISLPCIYTIYNEKYVSDDHFSYIVRVLTWRA